MRPVMQTRLHRDGEPPGNCFAAAIASLLEVPIEEVPWPMDGDRDDWAEYWKRIAAYLNGMGYSLVHVAMPGEGDGEPVHVGTRLWTTQDALDDEEKRGPFYIANGPGPRGNDHSVVMRDGKLEHDPHPDGGGLLGLYSIEFLVPLEAHGR